MAAPAGSRIDSGKPFLGATARRDCEDVWPGVLPSDVDMLTPIDEQFADSELERLYREVRARPRTIGKPAGLAAAACTPYRLLALGPEFWGPTAVSTAWFPTRRAKLRGDSMRKMMRTNAVHRSALSRGEPLLAGQVTLCYPWRANRPR
jgi:hypothetical protein